MATLAKGLQGLPCTSAAAERWSCGKPAVKSLFLLPSEFKQAAGAIQVWNRRRRRRLEQHLAVAASIEQFSSDDFEVERLLSTYGYMNVSSYGGPPSADVMGVPGFDNFAAGLDRRDMNQMSALEMGEGAVQTRIYTGRIGRGQRMGTRVLLKAYPYATRGSEVDMMAVNELVTHAALQEAAGGDHPNIVYLYGGFQTRAGEQWLVFRDNGQITGQEYAKNASEATSTGEAVGQWDFWDRFDPDRPILRRKIFITKLLRGVFNGLAFMHANGRLHQSLGPASVTLNTMEERDAGYLVPQIRDLAFAVDVSDRGLAGTSALSDSWERRSSLPDLRDLSTESPTAALSAGLWRRAAAAGARTPFEKKAFGIADDIYAGGLLLAYMVFVPLCEPGSIDGPSLQRLFENTFRLDIMAAREYCAADDRWDKAVKFMDLDDGAGWQLLQAMMSPNYRTRPTAEAVLNHRFMTGDVLA
ncbi:hypothetical protein R1sor_002964 [Riccia sorocarpa]|uniref:Protein kinase domain-containing protein n=1 Tax=Riccia sorocarpa TaxID=122646 RepID=A0ABD3H2Y6_9MARC